jgi:hypothetical protein
MSVEAIGSVPLYLDGTTGEVYVDPDDVGAYDEDDSGALFPFRRQRRLSRIDRRIQRLEGRRSALQAGEQSIQDAPVADIYQAAAASGMVTENQYNGLGAVTVPAAVGAVFGTGFLQDTINRNLWGKSLVLDSDDPPSVLVTAISVAGLPVNVGSQGTPLAMFASDSTRFGISFGRRLALTGQTFRVDLANIDTGGTHDVTGGIIADELNPYAMQRWMEHMLLSAAVQGFEGPGY